MERYNVRLTKRAARDLESIYSYIADELLEPQAAERLLNRIESAILSLGTMPERCARRRVGKYEEAGYRQILVGNFMAVFRIDEQKRIVYVLIVQYARRNF